MTDKKQGGLITVCLPITVTTAKGDVPPGEPVELEREEAEALVKRFGEVQVQKTAPQPPVQVQDKKPDGVKP